jgi:glycerophosphoryl diester phosphodiesterase
MRVAWAVVLACGMQAQVVVISHRGEHLRHRENTMAAFDAAYEAKADYIEVDIRTTSDGKLVLMHDASAERTMGVKEEIAQMTLERVRSLGVPTFDEALAFAETRMGIYMDCKQAKAADLVDLVRAHHMEKDVLVYCGLQLCKAIQQLELNSRM